MDKILAPIDSLVSGIGRFFMSRPRLAAGMVLLLILFVFFVSTLKNTPNQTQKVTIPPISKPVEAAETVPIDALEEAIDAPTVVEKASPLQELHVKKGDNLARIFKRAHIPAKELQKVLNLGPTVKVLKRLQPGEQLLAQVDEDNKLILLQYHHDDRWLVVKRQDNKFVAQWQDQAFQALPSALSEKQPALAASVSPISTSPIEPVSASKSPWVMTKVQAGQNLSDIFLQMNLNAGDLQRIMALGKKTRALKSLKPGQVLYFAADDQQHVNKMVYVKDEFNALAVERIAQKKFKADWGQVPKDIALLNKSVQADAVSATESEEVEKVFASSTGDDHLASQTSDRKSLVKSGFQFLSGKIQNGLSRDAKRAGLGEKQIQELVSMFRNINLKKLTRASNFHILRKASTGDIVAAELTYNGKTYQVIRFTDPKGRTSYYTPDGRSIQQSLSRAPLRYTYISSRFSRHRWQPILGFFRPHLGVDYAAPTGTPIKAAGDGKVIFMGSKSGYGKTVILKHPNNYTTLYAHLSRYGKEMRVGKIVTSKDTIGYVGRTGLATGSHLHYEIHRNNVAENPLTVSLPGGTIIPKAYRKDFFANVKILTEQLDIYKQANQVKLITQKVDNTKAG